MTMDAPSFTGAPGDCRSDPECQPRTEQEQAEREAEGGEVMADTLRELVAKWRNEAKQIRTQMTSPVYRRDTLIALEVEADSREQRADELEAALSAPAGDADLERTLEEQCAAPEGCVFEVERFARHRLDAKCLKCGETLTAHFLRDALQRIAILENTLERVKQEQAREDVDARTR